jgi:hypothetical protein
MNKSIGILNSIAYRSSVFSQVFIAYNKTQQIILIVAVEGCFIPYILVTINPLTPELNPSAQRCLTRFFIGDFAS